MSHLQLAHLESIMYPFTDPRIVTLQSNNVNPSPLLTPHNTFHPSLYPFLQAAFNHLSPSSYPSHFLQPNQLQLQIHNPHFNLHPQIPLLHQQFQAHSNDSHVVSDLNKNLLDQKSIHLPYDFQSNMFLYSQQVKQPLKLSTSNNSNVNLSPNVNSCQQIISNEKSTSPVAVDSKEVTNKNSDQSNRKMYYSNKRKEYEAREVKKALGENLLQSNKLSNCNNNTNQVDSFSCPICLENSFTARSLKEHYEFELEKFKSSQSSKNNIQLVS